MADELKSVYLIAGSDRPKVDRAVERLRARFGPDAVELHDASDETGDDVVAACNALGLFGDGTRLVVAENVDVWKAPEAKAIVEYLKSPAPGTTLALVGAEMKKDGPLAKAVTGSGDVLIWDVPQRGVHTWVAEQFKLRGVKVDADACRLMVDLVGNDLYELASEVDKVTTWASGDAVTDADIEQLVAPRAESPAFVLTDAWGARDLAGVLRAAERMLERSGDPRSRTIPRVVGSLTSYVGRIRACQQLEADGVPSKEAAARLKMHPFYVQKLYAQARNYSPDELQDVTARLADLDWALKGGTRMPNDLELERALVEITVPTV
ncbi:MAG TPA: DNA polymerase III subunit delta [Gaiellaceae bacterium]|jgi:DNA polymerase-3 subunit delta